MRTLAPVTLISSTTAWTPCMSHCSVVCGLASRKFLNRTRCPGWCRNVLGNAVAAVFPALFLLPTKVRENIFDVPAPPLPGIIVAMIATVLSLEMLPVVEAVVVALPWSKRSSSLFPGPPWSKRSSSPWTSVVEAVVVALPSWVAAVRGRSGWAMMPWTSVVDAVVVALPSRVEAVRGRSGPWSKRSVVEEVVATSRRRSRSFLLFLCRPDLDSWVSVSRFPGIPKAAGPRPRAVSEARTSEAGVNRSTGRSAGCQARTSEAGVNRSLSPASFAPACLALVGEGEKYMDWDGEGEARKVSCGILQESTHLRRYLCRPSTSCKKAKARANMATEWKHKTR